VTSVEHYIHQVTSVEH